MYVLHVLSPCLPWWLMGILHSAGVVWYCMLHCYIGKYPLLCGIVVALFWNTGASLTSCHFLFVVNFWMFWWMLWYWWSCLQSSYLFHNVFLPNNLSPFSISSSSPPLPPLILPTLPLLSELPFAPLLLYSINPGPLHVWLHSMCVYSMKCW